MVSRSSTIGASSTSEPVLFYVEESSFPIEEPSVSIEEPSFLLKRLHLHTKMTENPEDYRRGDGKRTGEKGPSVVCMVVS